MPVVTRNTGGQNHRITDDAGNVYADLDPKNSLVMGKRLVDEAGKTHMIMWNDQAHIPAMASMLGRLIKSRLADDGFQSSLKFPKMQAEKIGGEPVLKREYIDGVTPGPTDYSENDRAFGLAFSLWTKAWDLKKENILRTPSGSLQCFDLDTAFDFHGTPGHKNDLISEIAYDTPFISPQDNPRALEKAVSLIEGLGPDDYRTIKSFAVQAGYDEKAAGRLVRELRESGKTLRKQVGQARQVRLQ